MKKKPKLVWLEEYKSCGCSNVTLTRRDVVGYCPRHLTDRRRITRVPYLKQGYAGTG